nr:hypothetical protein [Nocardia nova]
MCVEHLPGRCLRRGLLGTFRPEELPLTAVDDPVDFVDQHMSWWCVPSVAQMSDRLAGGNHDRRPALRDRSEATLLIGSEHVDPEVGQQLLVLDDFSIGQPIGGGHKENRLVAHRTLHCGRHEYQRFALARFHLHRTRGQRVHRFRLLGPQHHPPRHRVTDRAAPDDLHCGQHRMVRIAVEQSGHHHLVRKVVQALTFRNMLGGGLVEVDQQIDRPVAVAAWQTGSVGETVVVGGRNTLLVMHR